MDQPKLERLLRIMQLLTDKHKRYSINELSQILSISPRSVYRYIDTFESVGFIVNKEGGAYSLARESRHFKTISDLLYFTQEEAFVLKKAIESLDPTSPAVAGVKSKLYSLYNFDSVAELTINDNIRVIVNQLMEAILLERAVVLKSYRSSNSGKVSDRLVAPIRFGLNMHDLLCYELSTKKHKTFKITRIESVEITDESISSLNLNSKVITDAFRISSQEQLPVVLKLSLMAANLLSEEYPMTKEKITQISSQEFIYSDNVCSYEGVGRFVLGLCTEVEVVESLDFKSFLHEKRRASKI